MDDIRLYIYSNGSLQKVRGKFLSHKYNSVEECKTRISAYAVLRRSKAAQFNLSAPSIEQYVIVQYTAPYESTLLEIINK